MYSALSSNVKKYLDSLLSSADSASVSEVISAYGFSMQLDLSNYNNAIINEQVTTGTTVYLWVINGDFSPSGSNGGAIYASGAGKIIGWDLSTKKVGFTQDTPAGFVAFQGFSYNPTWGTARFFCVKPLTLLGRTNLPNLTMLPGDPSKKLPASVTKYTPSTTISTAPKKDPVGNSWSPVYLPSTPPTKMPVGERVPEKLPDPKIITPYIKPIQPQPKDVPLVFPTGSGSTYGIVIPNPEPITSTEPAVKPNPNADPSQLPSAPSSPVAPKNIPDPGNTGSTPVPILPSVPSPSSAKGLLHVYNPTPAQVDAFGEWLWTTFSGDIIDTIGKLFNNPMDAVIGLHEIYCTPTESANDVKIRAGFLESNVASRLVTQRYTEIKCGAVSVPEYWHNYLDYSPYTKSFCYLPFIGIVELNADDIVGSGVEITYRIDVYNGSCIAIITTAKPNSNESLTYQFNGNCSVSVPITSGMMSSIQSALIGVATTGLSARVTAAVTAATGGTALPASVLAGSVAAGASKQGLTSKNQVQYSGSFGSSYGAMGAKKPFLIIKRPRQKVVYGYNTNYGYPSHKMVTISTCTGYLRAREVNVISPTATEVEKKMIEELLKSGVFVS